VKKYLIYGLSGSGKSTIQKELTKRGYHAIETDFEPGLSSWINKRTGKRAPEITPPFTAAWLEKYEWNWDKGKVEELFQDKSHDTIFFCGGANNLEQFLHYFDKIFALAIGTDTMKRRLQTREPERWQEGSPELTRMLKWNKIFIPYNTRPGITLIHTDRPVEVVVDEILEHINDHS
jgi:adenylate kinase family enzyme